MAFGSDRPYSDNTLTIITGRSRQYTIIDHEGNTWRIIELARSDNVCLNDSHGHSISPSGVSIINSNGSHR